MIKQQITDTRFSFSFSRQKLVFLQIEKNPIVPVHAEYRRRGSLKYEFSSELLRTPLSIMKMTNVKEQVTLFSSTKIEITHLEHYKATDFFLFLDS